MDVISVIVVSLISGGAMGALASIWYQDHIRWQARAETFKSFREEAKLNREYAVHNAEMASWQFGPKLFIPFRIAATERLLLSGAFEIREETREIGSKYLESLDHINAMIQRVEHVYAAGSDEVVIEAIGRYCSGQMDPSKDGQARGLPSHIEELLSHLDSAYAKELGR